MLICCFGGSPHRAIQTSFPERNYKPWEFNTAPAGHWENPQNRIEAIRWLFDKKLKFNEDTLKSKLSKRLFKDNGLGGLLACYFKDSPYEAISFAYPEKNYKR